MKGVRFVVDHSRKKERSLLTLKQWGVFWEDFYDVLVSESRKNEPTVPWEELRTEMERGERKIG
jgi:hypothetical protein